MTGTALFLSGPLDGDVRWVGQDPPPEYRDGAFGTYVHEQTWDRTKDYDAWSGAAVYRLTPQSAAGHRVYRYCGQDPVVVRYDKKQARRYGR